ncbi:MAG: peptidoglycan-binding protein [Clostridia bacterium]|nr:peptidoglycan-binding protein [Clostridia bacterium]
MRKNLSFFCGVLAVLAVLVTVTGFRTPDSSVRNDVSYAARDQYYDDAADMNTTEDEIVENNTTSSSGGLLDGLGSGLGSGSSGGFLDGIGGIGGIFGDAGDVLGSFFGDSSGSSSNGGAGSSSVVNSAVYIDPVPAATMAQTQNTTPTVVQTSPATAPQSTVPVAESVNPSVTSNPYTKPTGEIKPGDSGDGVKWIQWNFIYTGYGLAGKDVTGVYDDETVELVKKLQTEKGLTADGIVNDAVIDKIELLYFEHKINGQPTVPQSVAGIVTAPETIPVEDNGDSDKGLSLILLIIIIAAIWCLAIIVIIIILIIKKKKAKKAVNTEKPQTEQPQEGQPQESEAKENKASDKDMSLSDLFEEANKE